MTETTQTLTKPQEKTMLGGKYLTFQLAGEEYGLEILKVREIIGMMEITPVPCTPEFVMGVINLRGKVIPVTNLRKKFKMSDIERTALNCIIVVDVGQFEMGLLVDSVSEVINIGPEDIEETPSFGVNVNTEFILGMGKTSGRVTILLDIGYILANEEITALESIAQAIHDDSKSL